MHGSQTTLHPLDPVPPGRTELEDFAALAAHELLEPLVAIDAYATLARERLLEARDGASETASDLEGISRIATRSRHLVEALLHAVRPDGRPVELRPVPLNRVIADSVEVLAPDLRARDIEVVAGDLPEVSGEEPMLVSLFTNVVSNAVKYGPRGGRIVVEAALHDGEWVIAVRSDGAAIRPDDLVDIFEPFRRGRREDHVRGHGLGLSICRRIAERHGGRIGLVPGVHAGNTFVIVLPA